MSEFNVNGMPLMQMTRPTTEPGNQSSQAADPGADSPQFSEFLKGSMKEVNAQQKAADQAIEELATGESKDIHSTMIKMQQASVSLQMMMQVRTKIVDAYQEVMRTQV